MSRYSDDPLVEFIGEIGDHEKNEFLGNALALLFPIDWPEPFGLVMIESHGDGYAGYRLAQRFDSKGHRRRRDRICCGLDPRRGAGSWPDRRFQTERRLRQQFEARFTANPKWLLKYLAVYEELVGSKRRKLVKSVPVAYLHRFG